MKKQEVVPFHSLSIFPSQPTGQYGLMLPFLLFPEHFHKAIDFISLPQCSSPAPKLLNLQIVQQLPDAVVFLLLVSLVLKGT